MERAVLLNILSSILFLLLFTTVVSAQLTDIIPSSAFSKPTSVPISSRPPSSPSPILTGTTFQLENNVLGIQQRNPAINPAQSSGGVDFVGIAVGLLLLAGGYWLYKKEKIADIFLRP